MTGKKPAQTPVNKPVGGAPSQSSKEAGKEPAEKNDPKGEKTTSCKPDIVTGVDYLISVYRPVVVVDCHMHIMSGGCSPLPFLWKQIANRTADFVEGMRLARARIEGAGSLYGTVADICTLKTVTGDRVEVPGTGGTETEYRKHELRQSVVVAKESTFEIGKAFTSRRHKDVLDYIKKENFYKEAQDRQKEKMVIFLLCVAMPMDMEFAHIDGYYGIKVYNAVYKENSQNKEIIHYWTPLHDRKDERDDKTYYQNDKHSLAETKIDELSESVFKNAKSIIKNEGIPGIYFTDNDDKDKQSQGIRVSVKAKPCIVPDSETTRYEPWKKQLNNTELAMMNDPLKILSLFHYDPRRWQVADNPPGNTTPFENVRGSGLYLGFKMYTAQGYRPWDMRLPILKDFYRQCCVERIPVLNHCTPDGAYNFNRQAYYDFKHQNDPTIDTQKVACKGDALKYFNDNFVAPKAWEKVLTQDVGDTPLNTLRICLAHFGGAVDMYDETGNNMQPLAQTWCGQIIDMIKNNHYASVYTDISSSFANPKFRDYFKAKVYTDPDFKTRIRERILFGSDWYMTLLDKIEYLEYCRVAKEFLDKFDTSLWFHFTQVNPYRFYRLDEKNQIGRIAANIIYKRQNDKEVRKELKRLKPAEIDEINGNAAYIQTANDPYDTFKDFQCKK